nr:integrase, catalytic region, zinc finger, CCHC-type, peptidase aspartic, catalytic [Tanacetum cinerariifolium]
DVGKLKAKGDIGVFVGYSKEYAAFRIYNKRTRKIYESVNVNFDEISEMASKQFSLEPGLSNLNETGKSSNLSVSQVDEASKKDLEDLFQDFYDEYFDSSKVMKSSKMNVETPIIKEVFHEIADQEVLFDKMSVQLVELDKHVRDLKNMVLEKDFKISELEECVCNKDLEIEKCLERLNVCENKLHKIGQTNQTVHMIMPCKDNLYNGRKGIGFENPSYFKKAKDLRPTLYDEKVIGLGYTSMFLTHSDEALEIKKFKRSRENKIEFAYDYGNLNATYQTSSLKSYVPNVILEKIIIDLEDEVVSLLEQEKANLETIESLKSKDFESSENAISKSENQSENDCLKVEKECDKVENSKKKGSSNTSNVDLSSVSHLKLNKNVKRYSRKDLLSCNNSHLGEISSAYVYNDAMNVFCNSRMCDVFDDNNFFIFDDESVRISPVSKMPFRKKPRDSMNIVQICLWIIDSGCLKHMTGNRALLTNFVEKFYGTVRFGNNDFAVIAGY